MKAHEFVTLYDLFGRCESHDPAAWYTQTGYEMAKHSPLLISQLGAEYNWVNSGRPYYTVYPIAQDALSRVPLDVPCRCVKLPLPELLIRFGVGREPCVDNHDLRSILAADVLVRGKDQGLGIWCDFGESRMTGDRPVPVYSCMFFSLTEDVSVEEAVRDLDQLTDDVKHEHLAVRAALRYVVACCLLGENSDLIDVDVLSKDREDWKRTGDPKYAERAVRRGKRGWLIGAEIEELAKREGDNAPHLRRPHFGIRWKGKGRTTPVIVPISGCVVRGRSLTDMPTGYLDDDVA